MSDSRKIFPELPSQAAIHPLEEEKGEVLATEETAKDGLARRWTRRVLDTCRDIALGLMPYLVAGAFLLLAIGAFFGVSPQAAMMLLGLGAVGLGVLFAATKG